MGHYALRDEQEERKALLVRLLGETERLAAKNLMLGEDLKAEMEEDGKGIWIGILSSRTPQLLELLGQKVFRFFAPHSSRKVGNWYWVRFGFVD